MRRFTISTLRDFGMGKTSLEDKIHEECDALVDTFKSFKGLYICHYLLEYSWAPVGLPQKKQNSVMVALLNQRFVKLQLVFLEAKDAQKGA